MTVYKAKTIGCVINERVHSQLGKGNFVNLSAIYAKIPLNSALCGAIKSLENCSQNRHQPNPKSIGKPVVFRYICRNVIFDHYKAFLSIYE